METYQYILIETTYTANGILYSVYGIAYACLADGEAVILKAVPDLSDDRQRVRRLAERCTQLQLSLLHLDDVIEDFLAE